MDPNLLVISGLQMMDNFPYQNGKQSELIDDMANFCKEHREVKTHFELASFVDTELVQEIIQKLMPYKLLKYKKKLKYEKLYRFETIKVICGLRNHLHSTNSDQIVSEYGKVPYPEYSKI